MENNIASCLTGTEPLDGGPSARPSPLPLRAGSDRRPHAARAGALARLKADLALRVAATPCGGADVDARQNHPPAKTGALFPPDQAAGASISRRDGHPAWLAPGALHDLFAGVADGPAAHGFAAGHAIRIAAGRPVVWAFHDMAGRELGRPHGEGLADLGLDPDALLLVRARTVPEVLGAAEEAARYNAVGVVIISAWGAAKAFDLTASRRLALVAARSGVAILAVRIAADPAPGAAWSRWTVRAAASRLLEGDAPGHPAFSVTLLRHRGGAAPATWILEWDHAQRTFREGASR